VIGSVEPKTIESRLIYDALVSTILKNLVPETLSDFIDNVLQDESAFGEPFVQAEMGVVREAIIRLKSEKFAQMVRARRVVSQVAIAADSYNLPYRIFLDGSGILLCKFNEID
jgi:hypothetical protein